MVAWTLVWLWGCDAEKVGADELPTRPAPSTTTDPTSTSRPPTTSTSSTADTGATTTPPAGDPADLALPAPISVSNGRFATSDVCAECHDASPTADAMRDPAGRSVAPFDLWQSTMMANAARDPLWRAQLSAELAATPAAADTIAAKCTRCHAPMASEDAALTGSPTLSVDVLTAGTDATGLALDGVSCTLCHQIEPGGLGEEASFSGGYLVAGTETVYGPHADPFAHPMIERTGYTPTEARHVRDSALCATCHTLVTHAVDADGLETGGSVVEQGPYLEWQVSDFVTAQSCQGCHVPIVSEDGDPIVTAIAHNPMGGDFPPVRPRSPYGRHVFVGGNTLIPAVLRDNAAILKPLATAAAFDATIEAARHQLANATATLAVSGATRVGDQLSFDVDVTSLAGHKLPTGIPVRRMWLRTTVSDAGGNIVFEQGTWDGDGRIVDDVGPLASEAAGGPVGVHVDRVTTAAELPVWEAILADGAGRPTWTLLRAEGWVRDDRILPVGFDRGAAAAMGIDAVGVGGDVDFVGGGDGVHFDLALPGVVWPLQVEVELVYQPLSARWAAELTASGTPEALGLDAMLASAWRGPERVALATTLVP